MLNLLDKCPDMLVFPTVVRPIRAYRFRDLPFPTEHGGPIIRAELFAVSQNACEAVELNQNLPSYPYASWVPLAPRCGLTFSRPRCERIWDCSQPGQPQRRGLKSLSTFVFQISWNKLVCVSGRCHEENELARNSMNAKTSLLCVDPHSGLVLLEKRKLAKE